MSSSTAPTKPSAASTPGHSRTTSQYAPTTPSSLRETQLAQSPEASTTSLPSTTEIAASQPESSSPTIADEGILPSSTGHTHPTEQETERAVQARLAEPTRHQATVRTRLLEGYQDGAACGSSNCNHGTFSPRIAPSSVGSSASSINGYGGINPENGENGGGVSISGVLGDAVTDGLLGGKPARTSTTSWLADKHGVKGRRLM